MRVNLLTRTRLLMAVPVACLAVLGVSLPAQAVPALTGTWGTAIEVPGTETLSGGASAFATAISCTSAGNCSAGGSYRDSVAHMQPFVASQVNGTWTDAVEVPGFATLNAGSARLVALSCASPGNCSAGGTYVDATGHQQVFVVNEVKGTWRAAKQVPGTATLNKINADFASVSCPTAGNCAAVGTYGDAVNNTHSFVVNEVSGTWRAAKEMPSTTAVNAGGAASLLSVSCATAGNCAAVGGYLDAARVPQAFVVDEVSGTWRAAKPVAGIAALNAGGNASLAPVSCRSAGNCSAGGDYTDASGALQAFVVNEVGGTWRSAQPVPGLGTLNSGGEADLTSLSCRSAGNCSAGGTYRDGSGLQAFVVDEANGTWKAAQQVPGSAALNVGGGARVGALSCSSTGLCSAGGFYEDAAGYNQPFVVDRVNGTWASAQAVPHDTTLNWVGGGVQALSCGSGGTCSAGGYYQDSSFQSHAFVVSRG